MRVRAVAWPDPPIARIARVYGLKPLTGRTRVTLHTREVAGSKPAVPSRSTDGAGHRQRKARPVDVLGPGENQRCDHPQRRQHRSQARVRDASGERDRESIAHDAGLTAEMVSQAPTAAAVPSTPRTRPTPPRGPSLARSRHPGSHATKSRGEAALLLHPSTDGDVHRRATVERAHRPPHEREWPRCRSAFTREDALQRRLRAARRRSFGPSPSASRGQLW